MAKRYSREWSRMSRAGYCKHGVYVGGCGIDWMCGRCESSDDPHRRDEYRGAGFFEITMSGPGFTRPVTERNARYHDVRSWLKIAADHAEIPIAIAVVKYAYTVDGQRVCMTPAYGPHFPG